ncbi:Uma2 family endonuclease [Romeria aff. gracilis LEGE 07310]|uniref:Uma2 family endonuclease n=1 Tax=Vasconcelosia minhoensis LEGE 07310 TaxID=915328 RepID=A0A8J7AYJ1_9CYAN|nr:Uma2 family endonuclease [Romeria gracilis]MBE9080178.1 Uma2 family endonuclease [Romeria aff. gracilis LEGE 07310]
MVQTPPKSITLDEFLQLPETKPASEYLHGQIIQKPMPQGQHSAIQGELITAINVMTKPEHIAWAFPELRCTFGGRSIVPDLSVFQWNRLPIEDDGTIANVFAAHPDWTIEILSPGQSVTRVASNILHCIEHGCQLGWLIDPGEQLVQIYDPDKRLTSLESAEARLPAPAFVAGLQLTVGQLFGWLKVK